MARPSPSTVPGRPSAVFNATGRPTHLVIDVTGWYRPGDGATFVPIPPARFLDSRAGNGLTHMFASGIGRRTPSPATGSAADAVAVTTNLTIVNQTSAGYLTAGPTVPNRPTPRPSTPRSAIPGRTTPS